MKSILNGCVALIVLLCVCLSASQAASLGRSASNNGIAVERSARNERIQIVNARQAESDEESDEDDDEADIAQAQAQAIIQQQQFGSNEDSDEDGYDDNGEERRRRRRRRDVPTVATESEKVVKTDRPEVPAEVGAASPAEPVPAAVAELPAAIADPQKEPQLPLSSEEQKEPESETTSAITAPAPPKKPSVLILIRDALKKVTTLPTEQVATNALQYFQLFEHFLQQTIEEVIGDDDDDEEESTTVKTPDAEIEAGGVYTPVDETLTAIEELMQPELVTETPQALQAPKPSEPSTNEADKLLASATMTSTTATIMAPIAGVDKAQSPAVVATTNVVAEQVAPAPEIAKVDAVNNAA